MADPDGSVLDLGLEWARSAGPGLLSPHTPTIYVHGEIDGAMARRFVDALETLVHERMATGALINIASDGGEYFAAATMLGAMLGSPLSLATFASGQAFSAAAVLLSAGRPGARFMSPYGGAMIHGMITAHAPLGVEEVAGLTHFEAQLNKTLLTLLARNCGMTLTKLQSAIRATGTRTLWLMPEAAKAFRLVDHVGIPTLTKDVQYELEGVQFKV